MCLNYLTMTDRLLDIPLPLYSKFDMHRKEHGISIGWIADKLVFSYHHTYRMLNGKLPITESNRKKFNELFNTNY